MCPALIFLTETEWGERTFRKNYYVNNYYVNNNYMNNYYVYLNYQLIEAFFEHKYALFVIMPVKSTILTDLQGENNRLGLQTTSS